MIGAYTTRETVMAASDIKASAYMAPQIDRAIETGARMVDKLCHRGDDLRPGFLQWTGSISFDYPNQQEASFNRLWLDNHALLSLTSFTAGGISIPASNVFLYPQSGPPYSRIELAQSSAYAFSQGVNGWQGSLVATGTWGFSALTESRGYTLSAGITSTATSLVSSGPYGVGTALLVGTEWMLVTERSLSASLTTLGADVAATGTSTMITVGSSAGFTIGELVLIDAEYVIVQAAPDSTHLLVRRGWAGTSPSAHSSGAALYPSRTLTVTRGALGSTAASHSSGDAVSTQYIPQPVADLNAAYAIIQLDVEGARYARTAGDGDNQRLVAGQQATALENSVLGGYGRMARHRAV